MQQISLPAHIELAAYRTEHLQARFRGNKLIEALPPPLSEQELYAALRLLPDFDPASRQWDKHDRLRELLGLTNIMFPFCSHIELGFALDSMMREGYVGRSPMSPEHVAIFHEIHKDEQSRAPFRQSHETITPKLSTALVGVSGMGKTTTVQRVLARYPKVIYHHELDLYQIPWLHFEMPSDGKGVKSLLTGIIEAIAELIPGNTYYEDYVGKSRASESSMQTSVRRLLNKHCVGLLIPDEVQNAANTRKSEQIVMTELTTLANKSRTPVMFIGTPKASKVLGLDLRQGRRSLSLGLGNWDPLPRCDLAYDAEGRTTRSPGEWVEFVTELWQYSWLRQDSPLTKGLLDVIYDCTQGIIDLTIKLFILAQARAILDETEILSEQLFRSVYEDSFKLVHPMIDAYRSDDRVAMAKFEDLKSPPAGDMVEGLARRDRLSRGRAASTRPGEAEFASRLTEAGIALGLPHEDASTLAQQVAADGTAKNMLEAAAQLARNVQPPRSVNASAKKPSKKGPAAEEFPSYPGIDGRPDDMRHAIVLAAKQRTSIVEQLVKLNMIPEPEDVICLA